MAIVITAKEKQILATVKIPPRPKALMDINNEIKRSEPNIQVIADIIADDPSISASVLFIVNSAAYKRQNTISSIHQAVMTLGIKRVFPLVKAIALKNSLPENPALTLFWDTSSLVASACSMYVSLLNRPELVDNAYMMGLFHTAGVPVMLQAFDDYNSILNQGINDGWDNICALEQDKYNTSHALLGAVLAQQWKLSSPMVDVIYYFHEVEGIFESGELSNLSLFLLCVLKLARSSVDGLLRGNPDTNEWQLVHEHIMEYLDIDELQLEEMRESVESLLKEELRG
jgi:HD-like signal output (HDOD) protein